MHLLESIGVISEIVFVTLRHTVHFPERPLLRSHLPELINFFNRRMDPPAIINFLAEWNVMQTQSNTAQPNANTTECSACASGSQPETLGSLINNT